MGADRREALRRNFEAFDEALDLQFAAKGKARSGSARIKCGAAEG